METVFVRWEWMLHCRVMYFCTAGGSLSQNTLYENCFCQMGVDVMVQSDVFLYSSVCVVPSV